MFNKNKIVALVAFLLCFNLNINALANDTISSPCRYPDYAQEYIGRDKFEKFNRKMFTLNSKLNKYALKPIHIIWASIMPKYGMDRIQGIYNNIEYPKRLASTLIQKDFKASGRETVRFLTNTTVGLGGMFDPAKKYLHIEPVQEDMGQALAKCKVKSGPYLVVPGLVSTNPRTLAGKLLECPFDAAMYLGTPITALAKAGFLMNKTAYMQPLIDMIESTYADPYDIAKKLYGIETHIKTNNLDRREILNTDIQLYEMVSIGDDIAHTPATNGVLLTTGEANEIKTGAAAVLKDDIDKERIAVVDVVPKNSVKDSVVLTDVSPTNTAFNADMFLADYNPQSPVLDSMRTALFECEVAEKSIWSEMSVWNRSFKKQIKTSSVSIDPNRAPYNYRFILQKDKSAPVAILYPSIGEGINAHHSNVLAKMFYDEGYSVLIQGSHFHWEFVKSMPADYRPGIPPQDVDYIKITTTKILDSLHKRYHIEPREKIVVGTSFGAMTALFLADKEDKNNTLNINKYISINPPIELVYALSQLDKNNDEWNKNPENLKHKVAITASKIIQITNMSDGDKKKIEMLPFSEEEAKLITCFIMRQKLSDLVFTVENTPKSNRAELYNMINNMSYQDYVKKYLLSGHYHSVDDLNYDTSLHSISNYLVNNNNYKIYHALDDYFVDKVQLRKLKEYSGNKMVLLNNGSHLGFLYRKEFQEAFKRDIALSTKTASVAAQSE